MVIKKGVLVAFILVIILVSGCKDGKLGKFKIGKGAPSEEPAGITSEKYTGTQGLELEFLPELPPESIYDDMKKDLIIVGELRNKGAWENVDAKVYLSGYDPELLKLENNMKQFTQIDPKSQYTDGGIETVEFNPDVRRLPTGTDKLEFDLSMIACYTYRTQANPVICIDPRRQNVVKGKDACEPGSVSLSGGQGAPVAVTRVDVESAGTKTYFKIHIENVGGGEVVLRGKGSEGEKCPFSLGYNDVNRLTHNVKITGGNLGCGTSNQIRLNNGKATIRCTYAISEKERIGAFQRPLLIELNYGYMQSVSRKLEIVHIEE